MPSSRAVNDPMRSLSCCWQKAENARPKDGIWICPSFSFAVLGNRQSLRTWLAAGAAQLRSCTRGLAPRTYSFDGLDVYL